MMKNLEAIHTVTDAQLIEFMKFCAERMKIIIEPTGCLGLAGAKYSGVDIKGKKVGVIIGGGNIDLQRFTELIEKR
jgi:threonine dehydratase